MIMCLRTLVFFVLLFAGSDLFAQGTAIVMPMSKYVFSKDEAVVFTIHNQLSEPLTFEVIPKCDVDGEVLEGKQCLNYFAMDFSGEFRSGKIEVPKAGSVQGKVRLNASPKRYALYKPLIAPVRNKKKLGGGVGFEFRYQPGYLFLVAPEKAEFPMPNVTFRSSEQEKLAVLDFDLKSLTMPSPASISAKIIDKSSGKMLRFVRLASEKIFDPARGQVKLEAGYAPPKDEHVICLDIIVQWLSTNTVQKINNCRS
jgi:hypothetical protein